MLLIPLRAGTTLAGGLEGGTTCAVCVECMCRLLEDVESADLRIGDGFAVDVGGSKVVVDGDKEDEVDGFCGRGADLLIVLVEC